MDHSTAHRTFLVAATLSLALLASGRTSGQSQNAGRPSETNAVKPTLKPISGSRDKPTESPVENLPALAAASARNFLLRDELNWTFSEKQQLGWYLYVPLIGRLLDTDCNPGSAEFASALSRRQERSGLTASGILDEDSLYEMVSQWQRARLKDHVDARPDQLVMAQASDFYHPSRPDELRLIERETYAAYKRMIAAAVADSSLGLAVGSDGGLASAEKYLKIISSFRSREYQERLRRQSPNSGRAGLAANSPHFTGRALDLYVGGDPVETKDSNRAIQVQTPVYQWLVRNAERFGFRPYFYEPWHWEYVK